MSGEPKIGDFLDHEEADLIGSLEDAASFPVGALTAERRGEIEDMARATMSDEREKISLRVPRGDLVRLKSRALQVGIPYQTLINALIHRYVSK